MLFKKAALEGIAAGRITLAFRRWRRPTVRQGGTLRTRAGVLAIDAVATVRLRDISAADARRAGFDAVAALREELDTRDEGALYRIEFHLASEDPRIALRQQAALSAAEVAALAARLARFDETSTSGPWTRRVLQMIADEPGRRAPDFAERMGLDVPTFKRLVRKLKELGLTESLTVGYRLSPRGRALFERLP
jgi:DNA-binding MarR family transcriptional regulator